MIWVSLKFNSRPPPVQMGPPTKGLTVDKMYNMLTAKAYSIKAHNSLMQWKTKTIHKVINLSSTIQALTRYSSNREIKDMSFKILVLLIILAHRLKIETTIHSLISKVDLVGSSSTRCSRNQIFCKVIIAGLNMNNWNKIMIRTSVKIRCSSSMFDNITNNKIII